MFERKARRPLIVPVFIPNQGCPHRCIFCEQEKITAQKDQPIDGSAVKTTLDLAIQSPRYHMERNPEVAFYGGTFTSLPLIKMKTLLKAVAPYLKKGFFESVRISTRPDALDNKKLELLSQFGVSTVELGAQSMDDEVLELTRRGHRAEDTIKSAHLLRRHGFKVGIQLMPGLPGDTEEKFRKTVEEVIKIRPDMVRLYPTVVIRGTVLARWYREKRYRPLRIEEAVKICRESCIRLESEGIPVIRIGLMSSPSLLKKGQIVAGPWHDAFGFLVRSEIYHKKIEPSLPKPGEAKGIRLRVPQREIPLLRGYENSGLRLIQNRTGARVLAVSADVSLSSGEIEVEKA